MTRPLAVELEFDKVLDLVAAHARTRVGRFVVSRTPSYRRPAEAHEHARLTLEIGRLLETEGPLPFSGLDESEALLDPALPPPREIPELLALAALAAGLGELHRRLAAAPVELIRLRAFGDAVPDSAALAVWSLRRLGPDGQVPDDASPELARLRRQLVRVRLELAGELEALRRRHPEAVTDAPPTLRRDRYCLPVRAAARSQLPGLVLASSGSGATVFVEPFDVVERNNVLADTAAREAEEVARIVAEVAAALAAARPDLRRGHATAATLDAAQARTRFGRTVEGRVVLPDGDDLVLRGARHPLLDERLAALRAEGAGGQAGPRPRQVVPLDLRLPAGVRTLVISGPNAGGKTVALKTVGLMVLMASHGIPLPVDEGTVIPALDRVWCHIGDEQNVAADLSTFSAAMAATAELLDTADAASLALYDELGAATDPLEGAALGCGLIEELTRRQALTIATTHLAAIAMTADAAEGMENGAMEYDEAAGRPTFALRIGRPGRSHALEIAERMGLPAGLLERARALLGGEHLELDRWLKRLQQLETTLEDERTAVARERTQVADHGRRIEAERRHLERELQSVPIRIAEERERLKRRAKSQLDAALVRLDEAVRTAEALGKRQRQRLRDEALDLDEATPGPAVAGSLAPGDPVRIEGLGGAGELVELRGARALVRLAGKRLWVSADALARAAGIDPVPAAPVISVAAEDPGSRELMLLGLDAEAARERLDLFLDRALAAGRRNVRVVHGHGSGTLRRMVREVCRSHPGVHGFRHPPQHLGGTGVTEVELGGLDDG